MINENGACEFCGQIVLDGEYCNCPSARAEKEKQEKINRAIAQIDKLFSADIYYEITDIMKSAVKIIADLELNKISLTLPYGVKADISYSSGKIKITRTDTNKHTQEV